MPNNYMEISDIANFTMCYLLVITMQRRTKGWEIEFLGCCLESFLISHLMSQESQKSCVYPGDSRANFF